MILDSSNTYRQFKCAAFSHAANMISKIGQQDGIAGWLLTKLNDNGSGPVRRENKTSCVQCCAKRTGMPHIDAQRAGCLAVLLAIAWTVMATSVHAQGVPNGSPLDPYSTRDSNQSTSQSSSDRPSVQQDNPYVGQQVFSPYTVNEAGSDGGAPTQPQGRADADPGSVLQTKTPNPGEFELYIEKLLGRRLPRFGSDLVLPSQRDFAAPATATVPPDYIVQPGDTLSIALAGSMDGSFERTVRNDGMIFLPGVGDVQVAGVRNSDIHQVLVRAIGTQFRGFTASVTVKRLRGIRVYVTGLANNPGAFTVSSLSTLANAVFQAGGPSSGGSWRSIKLYRNGREVTEFDLYQLLRGGSRVNDVPLQNEDVLFIPPAGEQVAVIGSVHQEAIYEAKPGESIADLLAAAGGPNTMADRSRVILYRIGGEEEPGPRQVQFAETDNIPIKGGDILQMLSGGSLAQPIHRQSVLVRVDGEVNNPGIYYVPPNTPTSEIIAMAGGLTPSAYPFGTNFTRQSVKIQQQESFREAIRQLEVMLAAAPLNADSSLSEAERTSQLNSARSLLERVKEAEPDGRIVMQIAPNSTNIPGNILLENNDSIYVPPKATTVGVFGAVYRPASFLIDGGERVKIKEYIEMAGGAIRSGDRGNTFIVRANGEVISRKRDALGTVALPGDIVFVPVKTQGSTFWSKFKDITQTLFQLGLSAATVVAVTK